VQGALDELYVRCETSAAAPAPDTVGAADNALATRLQVLELRLTELEATGTASAAKVAYDPRDTTLAGKTVQDALSELEGRVEKLEEGTIDHGKAGPVLFELRDKHGNLVEAGPGGGKPGGPAGPGGPGGGKGGPPPNGQGGPPNGQGGPANGQQGGPPGGGQQGPPGPAGGGQRTK
jgi:hypothetical protein